jgi:molybdopterin/thiamine biosynthesis adenylyltransferase
VAEVELADLPAGPSAGWSYDEAFSRHHGLLSASDQQRLRSSRVAIAGMGGVGGNHLVALARLGIGSFHIADPDCFEVANFNRQQGATTRTLGRNKAEVMAEEALTINPELRLRVFTERVTPENVGHFLDGVNVVVDGIDFFEIEARRMVFREAQRRGIWTITAGPIGFSTAWLVFSPSGMSFDDYFDLNDSMDRLDKLIAFLVGLTPAATQRDYWDLAKVDPRSGRGPSAALACHLCSGVATAQVAKILLGRGQLYPVPWYFQFDAYRQILRHGRPWGGNRNPWRRFKRRRLRKRLIQLGWKT